MRLRPRRQAPVEVGVYLSQPGFLAAESTLPERLPDFSFTADIKEAELVSIREKLVTLADCQCLRIRPASSRYSLVWPSMRKSKGRDSSFGCPALLLWQHSPNDRRMLALRLGEKAINPHRVSDLFSALVRRTLHRFESDKKLLICASCRC